MRQYKGEKYLRSEHLFRNGKYVAAHVTIEEVIENCPIKRGDEDGVTLGLQFAKSDKVLGLNATNFAQVCWETGEGKPENWIGKKLVLAVRLVRNRKLMEPGIRVWPTTPHPNSRVREQMGTEVTDDWYEKNRAATGAESQ